MSFSLADLRDAVAGGAAGVRAITELEPLAAHDEGGATDLRDCRQR